CAPAAVATQAVRATPWAADGDFPDQHARTGELLRRHRREVASAQQLVAAPRTDLDLAPLELGPLSGNPALAPLGSSGVRRLLGSPLERDRGAEEPRVEGAVECLEILAPGDERLAKRPVHVLLTPEVDRIEPAQRVRDAARPDLQAGLAQHAPEEDDV